MISGTDCSAAIRVSGWFVVPRYSSEALGVRQNRIKIDPSEAEACYHCVTRTVNGEFLFDESAKEALRRMIWRVADFCGVEIITYAVLSNHFHVLVRVPLRESVSDEELLRRYGALHPEATSYQSAAIPVVRAHLVENGPWAAAWRSRQLALMGDVSQFMKLLKQRFSIWFNKNRNRFGTLWAERFRSVLIECSEHVLATVAAYIDLNAVRAGLANDPKDYRFCGYAEAVAGVKAAKDGICSIFSDADWKAVHDKYRIRLFVSGSVDRDGVRSITPEELRKVVADGGRLPLVQVLLCRVRYFTYGAVLGGQVFVEERLSAMRRINPGSYERSAIPLPPVTDWGGLTTMIAVRP